MGLTVQVPQVNLPNATEEPKIANTFTSLSTWANGNIADTDLNSPNNAVRRLILQATAIVDDSTATGDMIFTADSFTVLSGVLCNYPPPVWAGDSGLSSQPPDFQVANKTARGRVRGTLIVTGGTAGATITLGLYQILSFSGSGRGMSYTFSTARAGSTAATTNPLNNVYGLESAEFALPSTAAAYALGVNLSGALPSGAVIAITAQLYAYNS